MSQVIRRKRTKPAKRRRIKSESSYSKKLRGNIHKFAEFAKDKAHKIIEKKQKVFLPFPSFTYFFSIFDLLLGNVQKQQISENVYKVPSIFGDTYFVQSEIKVGEDYLFDDGVYQEFSKHFHNKLVKISDIDLGKELNSFLDAYFVRPKPKKKGRKQKEMTRKSIELAKKGQNASQITNTFAKEKFQELKESYLSEGFSTEHAENMATKDVKVWKLENTKRVQECLRYNGFSKRNPKRQKN